MSFQPSQQVSTLYSMTPGGEDDLERKRKSAAEEVPVRNPPKRSRFTDEGSDKVGVAAIAAASAKAAEIAKSLLLNKPSAAALEASAKLAKAAEMQAQLAAQIASVSTLFSNAQQAAAAQVDRKPTYRALLLDTHGREIDEYGQVVKTNVIKSIAANVAVERELKKKENPYLAHQRVPLRPVSHGPPGLPSVVLPSSVPGSAIPADAYHGANEQIDDRIVGSNRSIRAKKSLKFVEAGMLIIPSNHRCVKTHRQMKYEKYIEI